MTLAASAVPHRKSRMEHRWSARTSARLNVRVSRSGGREPVECHSSNIGLEGARLHIGANEARALGLRAGVPLSLEFALTGALARDPQRLNLSGIVVHHHDEDVGVMFFAPAPHLIGALRKDAAYATGAPGAPASLAPVADIEPART